MLQKSPYGAVRRGTDVYCAALAFPSPSCCMSAKKRWDEMSHCRTNYRLALAVMNLLSVCADKRHE